MKNGFTLIELLIVVAVLSILLIVTIPKIKEVRRLKEYSSYPYASTIWYMKEGGDISRVYATSKIPFEAKIYSYRDDNIKVIDHEK